MTLCDLRETEGIQIFTGVDDGSGSRLQPDRAGPVLEDEAACPVLPNIAAQMDQAFRWGADGGFELGSATQGNGRRRGSQFDHVVEGRDPEMHRLDIAVNITANAGYGADPQA